MNIKLKEGRKQMVPKNLKFTREHEWLKLEGDYGIVGITNYAQEELGEVVYVEMPAVDTILEKGQECGVVESVKTVSSLYMPIKGEVVEINETVEQNPEILNESPYQKGWLFKLKILNRSEIEDLIDAEAYENFIA